MPMDFGTRRKELCVVKTAEVVKKLCNTPRVMPHKALQSYDDRTCVKTGV